MWIDWGPQAWATAYEVLDRINGAVKGERGGEVELDENGDPIVMSG